MENGKRYQKTMERSTMFHGKINYNYGKVNYFLLVGGGIPLPLWKIMEWVRQLGWNDSLNMMGKS